jgi:surfactin synthase thioesterase subunit
VIESRPQGSSAFPDLAALSTYQKILFAFPWAGGGTSFYRTWQSRIGETAGICPIRLPGRESRLSESPFTDIHVLVGALLAAIRSHLDRPFAFYGHSMGAGIAFELTRALRREGLPMPSALFVSSARAPQLRTEPPPGQDPTDDELIRQLESLGDPIDNPDLLRLALPALRADTYLYRHYLYQAEAPLNLPVHIFGGSEDPSLTRGQLEAWREQTTGPSSLTLFPAGHFFFRRFENEFLEALRRDLRP